MLFTTQNLRQKAEAERMASHPDKCAKYISETIENDLHVAIGELKDETNYHFDTATKWNLHDLIVYLIRQIGPSKVYFSTYAIKEYQARLLTGMQKDGLITELHALMDYRVPTHDKDAAQLIEANATSYGYIRTHSKLTVIQGEKLTATITGSANLTNNTTADTGVITISQAIGQYRSGWILKNISNATN